MYILGVSALYHDSAAALIRDGEIVAAAQEERFTRIKLDNSLPVNTIAYCLSEAGLKGSDLNAVVFYDDPVLTLDRFLSNVTDCRSGKQKTPAVAGTAAAGDTADADAADLIALSGGPMFGRKLWIEKLLRDCLGMLGKEDRLFVLRHHISHAASAFFPSPFESAAILTVDGVGEWNTMTIGCGKGNDIKVLKKIDYPHSLGLLYSAFTYFCGFRVNFGDYKLMGLAPYGEPVYADLVKSKLIDIKDDGSFRLDLDYFDFQNGRAMTNDAFASLFGGPRREPDGPITKREMDIAASAQAVTEEIMLKLARTARDLTGEKNLAMAGGVALNCVANGKIARAGIFDDIWVQPAAGDAGGALGAALAYYHLYLGETRTLSKQQNDGEQAAPDKQQGSFLGPAYTPDDIISYLDKIGAQYHVLSDTACKAQASDGTADAEDCREIFETAAKLMAEQKVIGLFNGRMEYGPRALGHRSIIADPRSEDMQARLNLSIKYRESFRPFAPAVLEERTADYFDTGHLLSSDTAGGFARSPYMLFCADVKDKEDESFDVQAQLERDPDMLKIVNRRRSAIPAVTHVDHSARLQTVSKTENPFFHGVISAFEELTGCPVVINTSFNVRGEPIACSPEDAYRCFMNTEMDALIMENVILYKDEQPETERRHDTYEAD